MSQYLSLVPSIEAVLLASDFSYASRDALVEAVDLCRSLGARLTILHAFNFPDVVLPQSGIDLVDLADLAQFRLEEQRRLDALVEEANSAGLRCTGLLVTGSVSWAIEQAVAETRVDLVVLGTRGLAGIDRVFLGSTTEEALRELSCPVLSVGRHLRPHLAGIKAPRGPVIFATDFHASTVPAVQQAKLFANAWKVPLHCLNVLPETMRTASTAEVTPQIIPQIITEALHRLLLRNTAEAFSVCAVTYGKVVADAVVRYAEDVNASLVVLGVKHASALAAHLPAHTAYQIVRDAPCPVLTQAFPAEPVATAELAASYSTG